MDEFYIQKLIKDIISHIESDGGDYIDISQFIVAKNRDVIVDVFRAYGFWVIFKDSRVILTYKR